MNRDEMISVQGVWKKFAKTSRRSMVYGLQDIACDLVGAPTRSDQLRKDEFWAVQDVSFELKAGHALGIVGPNGSGKSTLLKILNGIIRPDKGKISIRGRVGALIEVGAGFHPMLTGRENIYVNGAILGMSKVEINRKFDSIIDFAGIGEFLDVAVKNYSSGMYVRLGFAIAAHCRPDILLVDEVLSVGDLSFQRKCFRYFEEKVLDKGVTLILVSHSIYTIARMCSKGLLLNQGRIEYQGDVLSMTSKYFQVSRGQLVSAPDQALDMTLRPGCGEIRLKSLKLLNQNGEEVQKVTIGNSLVVHLDLESARGFKCPPSVVLKILDQANTLIALSQVPLEVRKDTTIPKGQTRFRCIIESVHLMPGTYSLQVKIGGGTDLLQDNVMNAGTIEIVGDDALYAHTEGAGLLYLPAVWQVVK